MSDAVRSPCLPLVPLDGHELLERDMTALFGADVTLAAAQAALAQAGQWLPIDGPGDARLGDLVGFNSTGPLRLGFGGWRDLLLGAQFYNGAGELISAGGRTVKNVAGYDLTKFMVGSAGVFGRIATLTTRTYLRPHGALLATHPRGAAKLGQLMPTALRPQWAIARADALYCGYLGDERTLDWYRANLSRSEPLAVRELTVEQEIEQRTRLWRINAPATFRAALPPASIEPFTRRLASTDWAADPAFGVVVGDAPPEQRSAIELAAKDAGGSVRFEDGSRESRTVSFAPPPVERQILEQLKRAFDPRNTLVLLPWQIR